MANFFPGIEKRTGTCHSKTLLKQRWAVENVKKVGWVVG